MTVPKLALEPKPPGYLKTPKDTKIIRAFRFSFERSIIKAKVYKLFNTLEAIATNVDILQHQNRSLREAIIIQKNRSKRGKPLNLYGEESTRVEVYHSKRVEKARVFQEEKEVEAVAERATINARKATRSTNAKLNVAEKERKDLERQLAIELQESQAIAGPVLKQLKAPAKQPKPTAPKCKKPTISAATASLVQSTAITTPTLVLECPLAIQANIVRDPNSGSLNRPARAIRRL